MAANTLMRISASVIDELGVRTTELAHLFVDSAQTIAAVVTAAQNQASLLDAVVAGQVIGLHAAIIVGLPSGMKGAPAANSRVTQVGVFDYLVGGGPYHAAETAPSIANSKLVGNKIDLTDTDVAAYTALFSGAVLGGHYSNPTGDTLGALQYAFLADRKRRKQEHSLTFEAE